MGFLRLEDKDFSNDDVLQLSKKPDFKMRTCRGGGELLLYLMSDKK
jgi:hypothetical protein